MALSEKQSIFAIYLLTKIGFTDSKLISEYLIKLEAAYGKFYKQYKEGVDSKGRIWFNWETKYTNSECIQELMTEIEVRKNTSNIQLQEYDFKSKISATDLSSFDFCPASFSISKSFVIESLANEDKRLIGVNLHETLRLINSKIPKEFKGVNLYKSHVSQNEKINKIQDCELVFAGHNDDKRYFVNESKNYIGQPDYIFKDPNGKYFVVEEKFKYLNNPTDTDNPQYSHRKTINEKAKSTFFSNHIIQLQSYVDYIEEYNIEYGILVYWFYDFDGKYPSVHDVSLKVVKRKENHLLLENTRSNIDAFIKERNIDFQRKENIVKCVSCSVNKYCIHKTQNISTLKFPYDSSELLLKHTEFPETLKKKNE